MEDTFKEAEFLEGENNLNYQATIDGEAQQHLVHRRPDRQQARLFRGLLVGLGIRHVQETASPSAAAVIDRTVFSMFVG